MGAAHHERTAQHNLPYERLDRPARLNQLPREVVQQTRMTWSFASPTKVINGPNQSLANQVTPDSVRHHPRREKPSTILDIGEPLPQFHTTAMIHRDWLGIFGDKHLQIASRNAFA